MLPHGVGIKEEGQVYRERSAPSFAAVDPEVLWDIELQGAGGYLNLERAGVNNREMVAMGLDGTTQTVHSKARQGKLKRYHCRGGR